MPLATDVTVVSGEEGHRPLGEFLISPSKNYVSDPFHTGSSTGNFPGFFDFWYCRTNSVRSESFSDSAAGENPYCRFCTFAKLIFANVQNYSTNLTVFALRKGPTGLFGGNRAFFTNKEAYWATSIGSNGPFDSNFSGRFDSNFRNL